MKRFLFLLLALCLLMASAGAEEAWTDKLLGTWRFSGGAEVCSFGLTLAEDGSCTIHTTDDYMNFPPERLIPTSAGSYVIIPAGDACTLQITFAEGSGQTFPLTYDPAEDTIHLAEGDGGGFYQRCDSGKVVPVHDLVPSEIVDDISINFPDDRLVDFLFVPCAVDGDYAFALHENDQQRMLHGYRWAGTHWELWLETAKGIPQGSLAAQLARMEPGSYAYLWDGEGAHPFVSDGMNVSVSTTDGESVVDQVTYVWQEGVFRLTGYQKDRVNTVDLVDGMLVFSSVAAGFEGSSPAHVETDITLADFAALPATLAEITR